MYLAKLAHFFAPAVVAARKIFDADLAKYAAHGLHFRHTDNINYFLQVQDRTGARPTKKSIVMNRAVFSLANFFFGQ